MWLSMKALVIGEVGFIDSRAEDDYASIEGLSN